MTVEQAVYVRVPIDDRVDHLLGEVDTFGRRAQKARAGDMVDADNLVTALSNLETLARRLQARGAEILPVTDEVPVLARAEVDVGRLPEATVSQLASWFRSESVAVLVIDPTAAGSRHWSHLGPTSPAPDVFRSNDDHDPAVIQRFRDRIASGGPVMPSNLKDQQLADLLHELVFSPGPVRSLPVVYADGSAGPDVMVGGLEVVTDRAIDTSLSLSLISIRHMEMDALTAGSWFRNVDVSRRVPHGEIDADATKRSREQLSDLLDATGSLELVLYLTGFLPPAMSFFRVVTEVMRDRGGVIRVRPMAYRPGQAETDYVASPRVWSVE